MNCFDSLKNPIPCPVVRVPEGGGELVFLVALVGIALALCWWRKR